MRVVLQEPGAGRAATYALHMVTSYVLVGVVLLTAHRCSVGLVSDLSLGERSCFRE